MPYLVAFVLALALLAVPSYASAAEGQKRIDGVVSGDQRPIGAYQGPPGTVLRRLVDICNLSKRDELYPIEIHTDPPIATPIYANAVTVPARECLKYHFSLTIDVGEGKQQAWSVVTIGSRLPPLRRYVTRCPRGRQTCGARR